MFRDKYRSRTPPKCTLLLTSKGFHIINTTPQSPTPSQNPHLQPPTPRLITPPHPPHGAQLHYGQLAKNERKVASSQSRQEIPLPSLSPTRVRLNLCAKLLSEKLKARAMKETVSRSSKGPSHHRQLPSTGCPKRQRYAWWHSVHSELVQSMLHPCGSSHGSTSGLGPIGA